MSCEVDVHDGTATVTVHGALDVSAAIVVRERLRDLDVAAGGTVIVDLDGVGFIDSAGLSVLLAAFKNLRERDVEMRVVASTPAVVRVWRVTGVSRVLPLHTGQ